MTDCVGEPGPDGEWDTTTCTCSTCRRIDHDRIDQAYSDGCMTEDEAESAHALISSQAWT